MTLAESSSEPRRYALIAGVGYLVIIVAGIFAEFFVRTSLIVPGDAAATAGNIMASETLYRTGIAGDMIMLLCDAVVAVALYVLLRPVNRSLALMAALLRLVHTAVCGINLLNLIFVPMLLGGAGYLAVFSADQLNALALLFLKAHGYGYVLGLTFFGVHCAVLGFLVYKSGYIPKTLGVLLVAAALGYLTDSFAQILLSRYGDFKDVFLTIVAVPAIVAELSFSVWLIWKGGKTTSLRNVEPV